MTVLRLIPRDNRQPVFITGGIDKWRVATDTDLHGQFDDINQARAFLHLLILGNPERFKEMT